MRWAMRKIGVVLLLVILLAGCGTGEVPVTNEGNNEGGSGIVADEINASLTEVGPLTFQYEVKNQTEKEVTLEFTSSQRYDYSIKTKDGNEIFLYSSVTSYIQVLGEETIKQGEVLTYDIDLRDLNLDPGEYKLTAWMTPSNGPAYKVIKDFSVK
jgi:Intracellular proteinase inhibitor